MRGEEGKLVVSGCRLRRRPVHEGVVDEGLQERQQRLPPAPQRPRHPLTAQPELALSNPVRR